MWYIDGVVYLSLHIHLHFVRFLCIIWIRSQWHSWKYKYLSNIYDIYLKRKACFCVRYNNFQCEKNVYVWWKKILIHITIAKTCDFFSKSNFYFHICKLHRISVKFTFTFQFNFSKVSYMLGVSQKYSQQHTSSTPPQWLSKGNDSYRIYENS